MSVHATSAHTSALAAGLMPLRARANMEVPCEAEGKAHQSTESRCSGRMPSPRKEAAHARPRKHPVWRTQLYTREYHGNNGRTPNVLGCVHGFRSLPVFKLFLLRKVFAKRQREEGCSSAWCR